MYILMSNEGANVTTAFHAVGYDPATEELMVVFVATSQTFRYSRVTPRQWADMLNAPSVGKWFQANIVAKRAEHPFTKL